MTHLSSNSQREWPGVTCKSFIKCWQTWDVTKRDLIWSLLLKSYQWGQTARLQINKCKVFLLTLLHKIEKLNFLNWVHSLLPTMSPCHVQGTSCFLPSPRSYTCPRYPPKSSLGKFPLVLQDPVQSYCTCSAKPSLLIPGRDSSLYCPDYIACPLESRGALVLHLFECLSPHWTPPGKDSSLFHHRTGGIFAEWILKWNIG